MRTEPRSRTGGADHGCYGQLDQAQLVELRSSLDLFAPGTSIFSAGYTSDTSTAYKSGTSMAAPHVAGVAALWLEAHPTDAPADVMQAILSGATRDVVRSAGAGSPNRLVHSSLVAVAAPVAPSEPAPEPTPEPAPEPSTTTLALNGSAYKVKGAKQAQLMWSELPPRAGSSAGWSPGGDHRQRRHLRRRGRRQGWRYCDLHALRGRRRDVLVFADPRVVSKAGRTQRHHGYVEPGLSNSSMVAEANRRDEEHHDGRRQHGRA